MFELPLIFIAGLLGSSHCIGMCGPFALAIGSGQGLWRQQFRRQCVYSLGRIFTYGFLGGLVGFGGWRVAGAVPDWVNLPAWLAVLAGVLLIWQGLQATGWWPRTNRAGAGTCLGGGLLATFLRSPTTVSLFLAGLFTGFLPCGLVYAFLAIAASTSSLFWGAATMVAFGLGTTPVMVLTGVGGSLLNLAMRRRMLQFAAVCVIVTGVISVARGAGYLPFLHSTAEPACPFCDDQAAPSHGS